MKKTLLATALSALVMSGCASIVSESTYPVTINSTPSDANFIVTNEAGIEVQSGKTPYTVMLSSGDGYFSSASYTVTLKKEGYEDKVIEIKSTMDGWYIGNILLGGLIGMLIVDPATGAMWKLPETQTASLDAVVAQNADKSGLKIVSINEVNASDRDRLIAIN